MFIAPSDPRAKAATSALHTGNLQDLEQLLKNHPELTKTHIGDQTEARTLLHILSDHPGKRPNGPSSARILIAAGADVNAPFVGQHSETALHWAASNDDVALLDVLLDCGAEINAGGGVIDETPLADARAFLQFNAARRLIERGARATLQDFATLGFVERVSGFYDDDGGASPSREGTSLALWNACHGGQLVTARFLCGKGGDVDVVPPWEELKPLDAARRSGAGDVVEWLVSVGARSFSEK